MQSTPLIIDTDIGGDPDDAFALLLAAALHKGPKLVVTTDERGGKRARFARKLLSEAGYEHVPVVAGPEIGEAKTFCIEGLTKGVPEQRSNYLEAIEEFTRGYEQVDYLGIGPMSILAELIDKSSEVVSKLKVVQMGGHLRAEPAGRAEHNVRLDISAARKVLSSLNPTLVTTDVTFSKELEIYPDSELFTQIRSSTHAWAKTLSAHCEQWFESFFPGTMQHDPLTLSVLLSYNFTKLEERSFDLAESGETILSGGEGEFLLTTSCSADYAEAMRWISNVFSSKLL